LRNKNYHFSFFDIFLLEIKYFSDIFPISNEVKNGENAQ